MDEREDMKRQLMATFKAELEEHLGTLTNGLLALEKGPPEEERELLLADLFRVAHSIKGAGRAVGLMDIQSIAHRLEDVLGAIRQGELSPTPELFDLLFPALDFMREAMAAHLRGQSPPAEDHDRLLAGLEAILKGETPPPLKPPEPEPEQPVPYQPESPRAAQAPLPAPPAPARPRPPAAEEAVRVTTDKLDALMAGAGELLVARLRTEQRLAELKTLQELLGQWQKSWRQARGSFNNLQRKNGQRPEVTALLEFLARNEEHLNNVCSGMNNLFRLLTGDYRHLVLLTDDLQDGVHRVRMVPIATLFDLFPRMVRDLTRERGNEVILQVEGVQTEVDRQLLEVLKDPLTHLLRNAVDHGIEPPDRREAAGKPRRGTIRLGAVQKGTTIVVEVADDGQGIDLDAVVREAVARGLLTEQEASGLSRRETLELTFRSGLSTTAQATELSGRGVGLDVVRENLEKMHGLVEVETTLGRGTVFTLTLPLTLATSHVLLVEVARQTVAVPTTAVERILRVDAAGVSSIEGKAAIQTGGQSLPLISLAEVLELPRVEDSAAPDHKIPVVVLGVAEKRVACRVDRLKGTHEVVIKNLGRQLMRVRNVAGATILGTGQVVTIINVTDLMKAAKPGRTGVVQASIERREAPRRRVLVVDDSITTRTLEKNILENAGYQVRVAADGEEAWALVQGEPLDAIVADITMPRMDGFTLTEMVKGDERFKETPLVLVTSLESSQDRIRGLEAGADAYITKSSFDQKELLETIERLIG